MSTLSEFSIKELDENSFKVLVLCIVASDSNEVEIDEAEITDWGTYNVTNEEVASVREDTIEVCPLKKVV